MDEPIRSEYADDRELAPLIREYVGALPDQAAALRAALDAGDEAEVARIAHRIRGVGGMYGYPCVTDIGGRIEDSVGRGASDAALEALVESFGRLVPRLAAGLAAETDRR